jgi:hypothetical protein
MSSADGAPSTGSSWQKIKPKVKLVGRIAASLPKVAKPKKTSELARAIKNLTVHDYVHEHGDDLDSIDTLVLDIEKIQDKYGRFRQIKNGYIGLGLYLIFIFFYVAVLGYQQRTEAIGEVNDSIQVFFEKQKADITVMNSMQVYGLIKTKISSQFLGQSWTDTTSSGKKLTGRTYLEYFHVIGGLVITAVKGTSYDCFRGSTCFSQDPLDVPFYEIQVPGEAKNFSIPYNHEFGGYSVGVPASCSQEEIDKLLTAYTGLFGPDTREIWLHSVLFNPSGTKTVTKVAWGGSISLAGYTEFATALTTIPYYHYEPDSKVWQLTLEVALLLFVLRSFVGPLFTYLFFEPSLDSTDADATKRWEQWVDRWRHLPVIGGMPLIIVPSVIFIILGFNIIGWLVLACLYRRLLNFDSEHLDSMFEEPLRHAGGDIFDYMRAAMESTQQHTQPTLELVEQIGFHRNIYFCICVAVMILMVVRLQQYLLFQKRLAVVTDTFSGVLDDLFHIGMVLCLACFCFGVISSLAFGAYDPAFSHFAGAFWEMLLVCFGLFKPAASSPFVLSLNKYTPHTLNLDPLMTWLPIALQVGFKILVVLLLFKLLMGVIMESYKKHSKGRDKAPTVRRDLFDLWVEAFQYLYAYLTGAPYVCFFHVALALAHTEPTEEKPWHKHILGLCHPHAVMDALNAVLGDDMPPRIQAQVARFRLKHCGPKETAYVLQVYGTNRALAEARFIEYWNKKQEMKEVKRNLKEEVRQREEEEAKVKAANVSYLLRLVAASRRLHLGKLAEEEPDETSDENKPVHLSEKVRFTEAKLQEVFNEFDVLGLSSIDHRLMPRLLAQLGYHIGAQRLSKILMEYDENSDDANGESDYKELKGMLQDDRFVGLWRDPAETVKSTMLSKALGAVFNPQGPMAQDHHGLGNWTDAQKPLLDTRDEDYIRSTS